MNPYEFTKEDLKDLKEGQKLGSGGFGDVYLAYYHEKEYAIKKISKKKINSYDEDMRNYLYNAIPREIDFQKTMSRFENSVKLYFNYEDNDYYVLILEYCQENLRQLLDKKKKFSSFEILYIMKGLNKVFKYMVNNGIFHRDIKPENIMIKYIDKEKTTFIPKLTDYGVARKCDNGYASTCLGTPMYRAPETMNPYADYNNKCDLFSIGVMMYQLYFNEKNFPYKLKNEQLGDCEDKNLDDLIKKLLIVDVEKRISWEDYFNHPFFKGNIEKVDDLNNRLICEMKIEDNKEHELINLYDYILEKTIYQNNKEKTQLENICTQNFISIDECIKSNDDSYFILGILAQYLKQIKISVQIEKDGSEKRSPEESEYHKNLFQIICNGYILKEKYVIHFDLSDNRLKELVSDPIKRADFNEKFKNIILKEYNLKEEEIFVANIKRIKNKFTIVMIIKSNFNKITKEELVSLIRKKDKDLKTISMVDIEKITPEIKLSKSMLNPKQNNKKNKWKSGQKRGGKDYLPPNNWINYGINVSHCFNDNNNKWISHSQEPGEWCVGYCGLKGIKKEMKQIYKNEESSGKKVGVGVYCPCDPKIMEEDTEIIEVGGKKYKLGFMVRVNPDKIRVCEKNEKIWVVNGNDNEFRPYGILLKEIKN